MSWSPWMASLNDVLADLYPTTEASSRIVRCAGMKSALVGYNSIALINWFNILDQAEKQGNRAGALLDCALADYPDHQILLALKRGEPAAIKGPDLKWEAPSGGHFEKIIGTQSTLLPISFLEIGVERSRSVARLVRADKSSGTAFLIGGGWILTNNHVLPSAESAGDAIAEFNYQNSRDGLAAPVRRYRLQADRFKTSEINDWTAIGIDESAEEEWGTIRIEPGQTSVDAFVNIIQHPGGGPKQIAMFHNTVAYVGHGRVQYLTDTVPGSSGSPVFDENWKIVALHHSGGMLREPGTKHSFYRNEGIDVSVLLADLEAARIVS